MDNKKCFKCKRGAGSRPRYLYCRNKHEHKIHKCCSVTNPMCSECNEPIIAYSAYKDTNPNTKTWTNMQRNFKTKFGKNIYDLNKNGSGLKQKILLQDNTNNQNVVFNFKDEIGKILKTSDNDIIDNKFKTIIKRIKEDNVNFSNPCDWQNYLYFVLSKPN